MSGWDDYDEFDDDAVFNVDDLELEGVKITVNALLETVEDLKGRILYLEEVVEGHGRG